MTEIQIPVSPLTADDFSPFGDVMELSGVGHEINQGTTRRFHDLAQLDLLQNGGAPLFNLFRAAPRPRPIAVKLMERHPLSSQAFFPLDNRPWLVLVAPPSPEPSIDALRAFLAGGRQGVNYHREVWHHPVLALKEETDFVVIDRGAEDENCDEHFFDSSLNITIDY